MTELSAQDIFDRVVRHVSGMKSQSMRPLFAGGSGPGSCAYRGEGGAQCAIGCLLEDHELIVPADQAEELLHLSAGYAPGETYTFDDLYCPTIDRIIAKGLAPARLAPHKRLLAELQAVHDAADNWTEDGPRPDRMQFAFGQIADEFGLHARIFAQVFAEAA